MSIGIFAQRKRSRHKDSASQDNLVQLVEPAPKAWRSHLAAYDIIVSAASAVTPVLAGCAGLEMA